MGSKELGTAEWEALVFAPLCVYSAVASADGPPETSQFRRLTEELDDAHVQFAGAGAAGTAVETLRGNLDAMWAAYHAGGVDPQRGLKRVRGVLRRVPESEGRAFVQWLVDLAVRIGEARYTAGEAAVTERERRTIRDVAKWLGAPPPDLETAP
jgi:hypothetical protein